MSIKELMARWKRTPEYDAASGRIFDVCRDGGVLSADYTPFGRIENDLLDFRGYPAHKILVKNVVLREIDLSYADFSNSWMETNRFENCLFIRTDFSELAEHGNVFDNCQFLNCKFKFAVLGYRGSQYNNCLFKECGFNRTNFIRPEFVYTSLINCRLKGVDFNAASFEDCTFEGLLEDVWFRGTFPSVSLVEHFGPPKINKMENVSFEKADLIDLTISDGCDLSTVKLRTNGRYFKYDNWLKRLQYLKKELENWEDEYLRIQADRYVKVGLVHAQKQDWKILNLDDLERSYGGSEVARMIVGTLNSYSQTSL